MDRRKFCKASLGAAISMGMPGYVTGCENSDPILPPSDGIISQASTIVGGDLDAMTRDAIDALGGMSAIVDPGDTVFVKPNFVTFPWASSNNCFYAGECTKTEIILAVTEECLKAGADNVIIGEGSHLATFDWHYAVTLDGSTNLVDEANRLNSAYGGTVSLACLETDSPSWTEIPSKTSLNNILVSSLVTSADKVISIPVAKTHSWAQLTLGTKNYLGITPLSRYAQLVDNTWWNRGTFDHSSPEAISQFFLDIEQSIKTDLTVIDFSIGIEGDGPTLGNGGTTIDMKDRLGTWAIVASKDIMAADATAARIMNHNIESIRQLTMGFNMGLGEVRRDSIEILGEKLDNLHVDWKKASLKG